MNPHPYRTPPRAWEPALSPFWVKLFARRRRRDLRRQGITSIEVDGAQRVIEELQSGKGVLLISNHSYHFDSFVLIEAGLQGGWHPHIMTAWQVFMMYGRFGQWSLQKHGCFSVNREATDTRAFRNAVSILTSGVHPLSIYPEGDIYHSNDRVMPFREGAAAISLLAARQRKRPIVVIPCAMKCFYTSDPTPELRRMMDRLEAQLHWTPRTELPLPDRISRLGKGLLTLKELEYLGDVCAGSIRERIRSLANAVLEQVRQRRSLVLKGHDLTEQIRNLRSQLICQADRLVEQKGEGDRAEMERQLGHHHKDFQDLFFVAQLSSYRGDDLRGSPSVERIAETVDKFEEDLFRLDAPTPRGRREAVVRFGEPSAIPAQGATATQLTYQWEREVQELLDKINETRPNHPPEPAVIAGEM